MAPERAGLAAAEPAVAPVTEVAALFELALTAIARAPLVETVAVCPWALAETTPTLLVPLIWDDGTLMPAAIAWTVTLPATARFVAPVDAGSGVVAAAPLTPALALPALSEAGCVAETPVTAAPFEPDTLVAKPAPAPPLTRAGDVPLALVAGPTPVPDRSDCAPLPPELASP